MYLLTIAIPTYNRAEKLLNTLNNLIAQIIFSKLENDVEIVISDNASEDNTKETVEKLQKQYKNIHIRYSCNNKNLGWENLKIAPHLANGKYVWICSDDDIYDKNLVNMLLETIKKKPELSYIYIPTIQTNIKENGIKTLKEMLLKNGMFGALISSNVFKREEIQNIKPKSMTWYHMDLIFNMDMNSKIMVLPKLIDCKMPLENDPTYWHNKAQILLDHDTEIVEVAKNSKLPDEIKKVVYSHYKNCLPNEIAKYRKECTRDNIFVQKCAKRLKGARVFNREILQLKHYYLWKIFKKFL